MNNFNKDIICGGFSRSYEYRYTSHGEMERSIQKFNEKRATELPQNPPPKPTMPKFHNIKRSGRDSAEMYKSRDQDIETEISRHVKQKKEMRQKEKLLKIQEVLNETDMAFQCLPNPEVKATRMHIVEMNSTEIETEMSRQVKRCSFHDPISVTIENPREKSSGDHQTERLCQHRKVNISSAVKTKITLQETMKDVVQKPKLPTTYLFEEFEKFGHKQKQLCADLQGEFSSKVDELVSAKRATAGAVGAVNAENDVAFGGKSSHRCSKHQRSEPPLHVNLNETYTISREEYHQPNAKGVEVERNPRKLPKFNVKLHPTLDNSFTNSTASSASYEILPDNDELYMNSTGGGHNINLAMTHLPSKKTKLSYDLAKNIYDNGIEIPPYLDMKGIPGIGKIDVMESGTENAGKMNSDELDSELKHIKNYIDNLDGKETRNQHFIKPVHKDIFTEANTKRKKRSVSEVLSKSNDDNNSGRNKDVKPSTNSKMLDIKTNKSPNKQKVTVPGAHPLTLSCAATSHQKQRMRKNRSSSPKQTEHEANLPSSIKLQRQDTTFAKQLTTETKRGRTTKTKAPVTTESIEIIQMDRIAIYNKMSLSQERILAELDDLRFSLLQIKLPECIYEKNRRIRNASEFKARFSRNFLYPLKGMIDDFRCIPENAFATFTSNDACLRVSAILAHIYQSLSRYHRQLRYFLLDQIPQKLGSLISMMHHVAVLCIEKRVFGPEDELIQIVHKRSKVFLEFIEDMQDKRFREARDGFRSMLIHAATLVDPSSDEEQNNTKRDAKVGVVKPKTAQVKRTQGKKKPNRKVVTKNLDHDHIKTYIQDVPNHEDLPTSQPKLLSAAALKSSRLSKPNATDGSKSKTDPSSKNMSSLNTALAEALQSITKDHIRHMIEPLMDKIGTMIDAKQVNSGVLGQFAKILTASNGKSPRNEELKENKSSNDSSVKNRENDTSSQILQQEKGAVKPLDSSNESKENNEMEEALTTPASTPSDSPRTSPTDSTNSTVITVIEVVNKNQLKLPQEQQQKQQQQQQHQRPETNDENCSTTRRRRNTSRAPSNAIETELLKLPAKWKSRNAFADNNDNDDDDGNEAAAVASKVAASASTTAVKLHSKVVVETSKLTSQAKVAAALAAAVKARESNKNEQKPNQNQNEKTKHDYHAKCFASNDSYGAAAYKVDKRRELSATFKSCVKKVNATPSSTTQRNYNDGGGDDKFFYKKIQKEKYKQEHSLPAPPPPPPPPPPPKPKKIRYKGKKGYGSTNSFTIPKAFEKPLSAAVGPHFWQGYQMRAFDSLHKNHGNNSLAKLQQKLREEQTIDCRIQFPVQKPSFSEIYGSSLAPERKFSDVKSAYSRSNLLQESRMLQRRHFEHEQQQILQKQEQEKKLKAQRSQEKEKQAKEAEKDGKQNKQQPKTPKRNNAAKKKRSRLSYLSKPSIEPRTNKTTNSRVLRSQQARLESQAKEQMLKESSSKMSMARKTASASSLWKQRNQSNANNNISLRQISSRYVPTKTLQQQKQQCNMWQPINNALIAELNKPQSSSMTNKRQPQAGGASNRGAMGSRANMSTGPGAGRAWNNSKRQVETAASARTTTMSSFEESLPYRFVRCHEMKPTTPDQSPDELETVRHRGLAPPLRIEDLQVPLTRACHMLSRDQLSVFNTALIKAKKNIDKKSGSSGESNAGDSLCASPIPVVPKNTTHSNRAALQRMTDNRALELNTKESPYSNDMLMRKHQHMLEKKERNRLKRLSPRSERVEWEKGQQMLEFLQLELKRNEEELLKQQQLKKASKCEFNADLRFRQDENIRLKNMRQILIEHQKYLRWQLRQNRKQRQVRYDEHQQQHREQYRQQHQQQQQNVAHGLEQRNYVDDVAGAGEKKIKKNVRFLISNKNSEEKIVVDDARLIHSQEAEKQKQQQSQLSKSHYLKQQELLPPQSNLKSIMAKPSMRLIADHEVVQRQQEELQDQQKFSPSLSQSQQQPVSSAKVQGQQTHRKQPEQVESKQASQTKNIPEFEMPKKILLQQLSCPQKFYEQLTAQYPVHYQQTPAPSKQNTPRILIKQKQEQLRLVFPKPQEKEQTPMAEEQHSRILSLQQSQKIMVASARAFSIKQDMLIHPVRQKQMLKAVDQQSRILSEQQSQKIKAGSARGFSNKQDMLILPGQQEQMPKALDQQSRILSEQQAPKLSKQESQKTKAASARAFSKKLDMLVLPVRQSSMAVEQQSRILSEQQPPKISEQQSHKLKAASRTVLSDKQDVLNLPAQQEQISPRLLEQDSKQKVLSTLGCVPDTPRLSFKPHELKFPFPKSARLQELQSPRILEENSKQKVLSTLGCAAGTPRPSFKPHELKFPFPKSSRLQEQQSPRILEQDSQKKILSSLQCVLDTPRPVFKQSELKFPFSKTPRFSEQQRIERLTSTRTQAELQTSTVPKPQILRKPNQGGRLSLSTKAMLYETQYSETSGSVFEEKKPPCNENTTAVKVTNLDKATNTSYFAISSEDKKKKDKAHKNKNEKSKKEKAEKKAAKKYSTRDFGQYCNLAKTTDGFVDKKAKEDGTHETKNEISEEQSKKESDKKCATRDFGQNCDLGACGDYPRKDNDAASIDNLTNLLNQRKSFASTCTNSFFYNNPVYQTPWILFDKYSSRIVNEVSQDLQRQFDADLASFVQRFIQAETEF